MNKTYYKLIYFIEVLLRYFSQNKILKIVK